MFPKWSRLEFCLKSMFLCFMKIAQALKGSLVTCNGCEVQLAQGVNHRVCLTSQSSPESAQSPVLYPKDCTHPLTASAIWIRLLRSSLEQAGTLGNYVLTQVQFRAMSHQLYIWL